MTDTETGLLNWRKSSFSGGGNGGCVEIADLPDGGWAVRDSKDRQGPVLRFLPHEVDAFLKGVRAGEFG